MGNRYGRFNNIVEIECVVTVVIVYELFTKRRLRGAEP